MKRILNDKVFFGLAFAAASSLAVAHPGHVHGPESHAANAVPVYQQQQRETVKVDVNVVPENPAMPKGALTGASIFVSPGHGWLFNQDGKWHTQRGVSHGMIEDHSNAEAMLQYLVPYLENAGARVYTARERDFNPNMVIVEEPKLEGAWSDERLPGTRNELMWFAASTAGEATATATFTPEIPADGTYAVYAWYRSTKEGVTSVQTSFRVKHSGGETDFVQNQNLDTRTWKFIGNYYFEKGTNAESGSVVVNNATGADGQFVVVDAIRFGGGMSDSIRKSVSLDAPRFEESGMYNVQYNGLQPQYESRGFNSVSAMPMWAEWEAEPYEKGKSIYVAWHTNASGGAGTTRGLSSYVYGPDAWAKLDRFSGFPGSEYLVQVVHSEIMNDVRAAVEPGWADYGIITRWLGETNPRNNNKMPAALFEYGFHDNAQDAALIVSPDFRRACARATYQGIVKFYSQHMEGFDNAALLPEPPTHLQVIGDGVDTTIRWQAPSFNQGDNVVGDAATAYIVYKSANGKGFDNGTEVSSTEMTVPSPEAGTTAYYRVAAKNAGGISWPSETLAVAAPGNQRKVLLVNGFDRLDSGMNLVQKDGAQRGILSKMNTFDYAIQHVRAVTAAGYGVDSSSNEALTSGMLEAYPAVVWILGKEKGKTEALSAAEREMLANYLTQGGGLFISGSDLAADLSATEDGKTFLAEYLHSTFANDDAGTTAAKMGSGGFLAAGDTVNFKDGGGQTYPSQSPDVIQPTQDAEALMSYSDGAAALSFAGKYKLVYLAFPFETIDDEAQAKTLMTKSLEFLIDGAVRTAMK